MGRLVFLFILICGLAELNAQISDFKQYKLEFGFEGSDIACTQNACYVAGAGKTGGLSPMLLKLGPDLKPIWIKKIDAPIRDCGLSSILIQNDRIFVSGMNREHGFVAELNADADTLFTQITGHHGFISYNDSQSVILHRTESTQILDLTAGHHGKLLIAGEAMDPRTGKISGYAQHLNDTMFYPSFFRSEYTNAWNGIAEAMKTDSGFLMATEMGMGKSQQSFTLLETDRYLRQKSLRRFGELKRGQMNTLCRHKDRYYLGGELYGNYLVVTDLDLDSLCSLRWGPDDQDDINDLISTEKGVLALHQWDDSNAVSLLDNCSIVETLVLPKPYNNQEKASKIIHHEKLGYLVLSHGKHLNETDNRFIHYISIHQLRLNKKIEINAQFLYYGQ